MKFLATWTEIELVFYLPNNLQLPVCFKITGRREVLHAEAVFMSPLGCYVVKYIKPSDSGSEHLQGISSDGVLKTKSFGALTPVEQKAVGQKLERSYYVWWNCMSISHGTGWDELWATRHADDNVYSWHGADKYHLWIYISTSGTSHFIENEVDILSGCCYFPLVFSFCSFFPSIYSSEWMLQMLYLEILEFLDWKCLISTSYSSGLLVSRVKLFFSQFVQPIKKFMHFLKHFWCGHGGIILKK